MSLVDATLDDSDDANQDNSGDTNEDASDDANQDNSDNEVGVWFKVSLFVYSYPLMFSLVANTNINYFNRTPILPFNLAMTTKLLALRPHLQQMKCQSLRVET